LTVISRNGLTYDLCLVTRNLSDLIILI